MTSPYRIVTVCTGNTCRSPMAALMLRQALHEELAEGSVSIDSAGTDDTEPGRPTSPRAVSVLARHGLKNPEIQQARTINSQQLRESDLILALDTDHAAWLCHQVPESNRSVIRLLREFDPQATADQLGIADPWHGELSDFEETYHLIAAALPGVVAHVRASVASHA